MKTFGGLLLAVGGGMVLIMIVWASIIGFYTSDVPALAVLGVGGLVLGGIGRIMMSGSERTPHVPGSAQALAVSSSSASPPALVGATAFARSASDPSTPPGQLAELAHQHPQLRSAIAANPSAYPGLLIWLGALGDADVDAVLATRRAEGELRAEAENSATDPARLAEIAYSHPELRTAIATNANCYPALGEWIAQAAGSSAPNTVTIEPSTHVELDRGFWTVPNIVNVCAIALVSIVGGWVGLGIMDAFATAFRGY